jgi:isopenicillin-N epimerase
MIAVMPPPESPLRPPIPGYSPLFSRFALEPGGVFLNHGSFGATPRVVIEALNNFRARMEAEPVRFFVRELEPLLDESRHRMASFVGADADGFAFVRNATEGVSTVVRSLTLQPGDEILTSDHEYNACNNALALMAERTGARIVRARVPFPIRQESEVTDAILAACTPRTRLALVSHITSPTGLVLPVEAIIPVLAARGIEVLLDGAHAPGHLPLNVSALAALGCTYYTGNFHKWVCAPKGCAFLWVHPDRREGARAIVPLSISHGFNSARADRSRFRLLFDFAGTADYAPFLAAPFALDAMAAMSPGGGDEGRVGGWPGIMKHNRDLALAGRAILIAALGTEPTCPESMVGALATATLPARTAREADAPTAYHDPLQDRLITHWSIQVPIVPFPAPPARHVRIAAQVYNTPDQYRYLARALLAETTPTRPST